ncbi:hypothetical protein FPV67DRAFT_1391882, partial [Lyophyllum atratum]
DGSGYEGGVGASAVLFVNGAEKSSLQYHLGPITHHTVYEAEIVGFTLALHLLSKLGRQLTSLTVIGSDSQAAIRALNNQRPHPAHYLLDRVHSAAEHLHMKQDRLINAIIWTPGHMEFDPNERADEIAKEAAQGTSSPSELLPAYLKRKPLPASIPALRQE